MIRFAAPELLALLALIPLYLVWRARSGRAAAVGFAMIDAARGAGRRAKARLGGVRTAIRVLALALLVVALARPQVGRASTEVQASGVDMVLALDVSGSMQATDLAARGEATTRLDVVKDVVRSFIAGRPNDRVGLVAFAGAPYLVSPLTLDHDWLEQNLDRVKLGMIEDGTALGNALVASVNRMRGDDHAKSRVVVLLTDGVSNAGDVSPELAAEAAAAMGVKVHTIAVGRDGKVPITVTGDDGAPHLAEAELDEDTLRHIAETTGGTFFRATDKGSLERIYADIDRMEKTTRTVSHHERWAERFAWLALPALGLLLGELGLAFTRFRTIP
ncbi:MAG: VWA domain-containing protein [Deltaproteobacteria bacterium]|nr:VWA domain-containing protein [Deltaproteobacteria bacterium]